MIGIRVILLDLLDCGDSDRTRQRRDLYASYEFTPLPSNTLRMVLPIGDVRALVAEF